MPNLSFRWKINGVTFFIQRLQTFFIFVTFFTFFNVFIFWGDVFFIYGGKQSAVEKICRTGEFCSLKWKCDGVLCILPSAESVHSDAKYHYTTSPRRRFSFSNQIPENK